MTTTTEPKCNFCDKQGLLIMPVRYAIAPLDMGLPVVTAPLKVEDTVHSVGKGKKQDLTLHGSAGYTTRVLRSGYLYVYDEKRDRMTAYWITQDGYYMSFPLETAVSEQAKTARPCDFAGHKELAGCIAIPDAEQAGIVWLGYSDVQWTPAVIAAHKGNAGKSQREMHMRAFDASAWAKTHQTPPGQATAAGRGNTVHAVGMGALASAVADYAPAAKSASAGSRAFTPPSSPHFHARAGQAEGTLSACRRRSAGMQAAIVALDDPAGVAQDLAALINWHQERLLDTRVEKGKYDKENGYGNYATTYRHLVALDGAIKSLRVSNDEKIKMQVFSNANSLADYMKVSYDLAREEDAAIAVSPVMANRPVMPGTFVKKVDPADLARQQQMDALLRNPSQQKIKIAQDDSWKVYLNRIKPTLYDNWAKDFKTVSDKLQEEHIEALAKAHAAWMQSNLLSNKLDCTHDGKDPQSGDVYAETLQRCMAATQQIEGCAQVYRRWLSGDITERTNLLLRALVLHQDELISAMQTLPLDPAKLPWAEMMDKYAKHVQALLKPASDAKLQAQAAHAAVAQAKKKYDEAFADFVDSTDMSSGLALADTPLKRKAEQAEAEWKASQVKAREQQREAVDKLLPDSVASVLVQIAAPIATMLREFNDNAAEKTLARWMAVVGVTLRTPAGVIEVSGKAGETIEFLSKAFMDHMTAQGKQSGKPLSENTIRQLTSYTKKQVRGSFASGNIGSFELAVASKDVKAKMAVFIPGDMNEQLAKIADPTKKVKWLVENVTTPRNLHEYGVLKVGRAPLFGAVSEGGLTVIDVVCKWATWQQMLTAETKALSFQKTREQDTRYQLGRGLFAGALATGVANVVKGYGAWRNIYATGMAERVAGEQLARRAALALRVAGGGAAAVSGVVAAMDIADAVQSGGREQWALMSLQLLSGFAGIVVAGFGIWAAVATEGGATVVAGLSLTGWGLVFAVVLVALSMLIDHVRGDNFAQWLERCYWGGLAPDSRYASCAKERSDFHQAMAGV
ncbi:hypothetical protein LMG24238_02428 [Paraburkholderia sediminicola]|uniref:Toxin VasX N-terminal region domain-containing protein n=1 Tax=Paraburkholderia sediminicola TaxID=458836 RepID=A0A6J5APR1_9BURK|nr:T6SS effector BTH_I2691 family protein [Paraburkholderia sediminicola]CAB3677252.1 hypothetical protein LMG24238_02428 [Paraburkholderia sediminicola]